MSFQVEVTGLRPVLVAIGRLQQRMSDLVPFWEYYEKQWVYPKFRYWFETEGEGRWAPLSPLYAAWKAVHYPGRKILELIGALRLSMSQPNAPGAVRRLSKDRAEWGTSNRVAKFHQFGTRKMPRRAVIEFDAGDVKDLQVAAQQFYANMMREAFRG